MTSRTALLLPDSSTEGSYTGSKLLCARGDLSALAGELGEVATCLPGRINADPQEVDRGLARLVLTLIELIRRLMEKQAIRRVEAGSLTDEEIERLGQTLLKLEARMGELKAIFGLEDEDLDLDLGPLGNLM